MPINVNTGSDAFVGPEAGIDSNLFGYRFTGFRSLDRFDAQTAGDPAGLISWPGGYLVEDRTDLYGLEYVDNGLANPDSGFPSIADVMEYAVRNNHGLAVTLPTMHWHEDIPGYRVQVQEFMHNLVSGVYGPLPNTLIIEVGSEFYGHAAHLGHTVDEMAPSYGEMANALIEEVRAAENDPTVNVLGADIQIAVQAGRHDADEDAIIAELTNESLAEIDLIINARMPINFGGVDRDMPDYDSLTQEWTDAITAAGGDAPHIFLTSFNTASPTRTEAMNAYVATNAENGVVIDPNSIDTTNRTDAEFEQFWQDRIERFDLGFDQPRMLMELFAEYHEAGMIAGTAFGADQLHPGRLSFADVDRQPVSFIGMDFLNFLYESVDETRMLDISVTNTASTPNPVYAFEGDTHTTIFVMGGRTPGEVELNIEGLSQEYTRAYVDTLTPEVPADWMERFAVPDNPDVDETPESETFAEGVLGTQAPEFRNGNMVVHVEEPGQVIRIVLARSDDGEAAVEDWVVDPEMSADLAAVFPDDPDPDPEDPSDEDEVTSSGGDGGIGMIFFLLLPLLALAGMG